jgi:hypothetical protein
LRDLDEHNETLIVLEHRGVGAKGRFASRKTGTAEIKNISSKKSRVVILSKLGAMYELLA